MKMRWINTAAAIILMGILAVPFAQAGNEYTGPSFKFFWDFGSCGISDELSIYWGTQRILWSNSNTGHAQFKCKLELTDGEPQIFYWEFFDADTPIAGGDGCYNTVSLEGNRGMWIAQCFGVFNYDD